MKKALIFLTICVLGVAVMPNVYADEKKEEIAITVEVPSDETDTTLGKKAKDLQENITIGDDGKITGTLKYVTDFTQFSTSEDQQKGNFLFIKVKEDTSKEDGDKVEVGFVKTAGEQPENYVTLTGDGLYIAQIFGTSEKQILKVKYTKKNGDYNEKEFDISTLTLSPDPALVPEPTETPEPSATPTAKPAETNPDTSDNASLLFGLMVLGACGLGYATKKRFS